METFGSCDLYVQTFTRVKPLGTYIHVHVLVQLKNQCAENMSRLVTKQTKWNVRPAKTQISLGTRLFWSVFTVRMKKAWVLSYPLRAQRRPWSDWADAQADLSLRWAHSHFVGFVTRRLICRRSGKSVLSNVMVHSLVDVDHSRHLLLLLLVVSKLCQWTGNRNSRSSRSR